MLRGRNSLLAAFVADFELLRPHLQTVRIGVGEVVCEPGERIRFVYFPHRGAISKLTVLADGSEIETALVGREGAIGASAALGLQRSNTLDVCHLEAHASRVQTERFLEAYRASRQIHQTVDGYCIRKMAFAIRGGACNALHSVEQRLCRWLLICSDVLEQREIGLSQEVFAKMIGVQRTSVNTVLQDLKLAGAISLGRSRLTILDRTTLLKRSCECYAAMRFDFDIPAAA